MNSLLKKRINFTFFYTTLTLLFLLITPISKLFALTLPATKVDFCQRIDQPEILQDYATNEINLMSFKNSGGLLNKGVCWWHSRFQRNIIYLSVFRPDLAKPSIYQAKVIIKKVREGKSIVTIPGYYNFHDFSSDYKKEIIAELESWQLFDGILLGGWIIGIQGDTTVSENTLKTMMDNLYQYVHLKKKVAYQKLQIKGITSHSWLVVGIKKHENGYDFGIIDSNDPKRTEFFRYKSGDTHFYTKSYGNFVPYLEFTREEERLKSVVNAYCKNQPLIQSNQWDEDYRLDLEEARRDRALRN